jgi:hypothetical protein
LHARILNIEEKNKQLTSEKNTYETETILLKQTLTFQQNQIETHLQDIQKLKTELEEEVERNGGKIVSNIQQRQKENKLNDF